MKKVYLGVFFIILNICSFNGYAGELIYRSGYIKPGCSVTYPVDTFLTFKLSCGSAVVAWNSYGLSATITNPGPVLVDSFADKTNYDFNCKDEHGSLDFCTISAKGPSNVFAERPLSANYRAYSNDGLLDKPVILVEGYDPDNEIKPDFYYDRGFEKLVYGGRDLFIVNFPEGGGGIDENALLLQRIIYEINSAKTGNYPTAVIGYSMGGIVARKALKDMEANGFNHQTSLYVSFDSPHLGANAPMSLQNTVESMINKLDRDLFGYTPGSLKRARYIYNSPAAREMLIAGPDYQSVDASSFPKNLARVAVTSGSLSGVLQDYSVVLGEQVAQFKIYFKKNEVLQMHIDASFVSQLRGNQYYDNVPGSYEYQFDETLNKIKVDAASVDVSQDPATPYPRRITFVPTLSALAIPGPSTIPAKDTFKYESPFDQYIAADQIDWPSCAIFHLQKSLGFNTRHNPHNNGEVFNASQISQIKCALDDYQKPTYIVPDRSFKTYYSVTTPEVPTTSSLTAVLIPIWSLLLR